MIPSEVAAIATLIAPGWPDLDDDNQEEAAALREIIAAAYRVYHAGYRCPQENASD